MYHKDPETGESIAIKQNMENWEVVTIISYNWDNDIVVWCIEDVTGNRAEWDPVEDWIKVTNND
jgi:hypothetical protein